MTDEERTEEHRRWDAEIERRIEELTLATELKAQGETTYAGTDLNGIPEIRVVTLEDF